MDAATRNYLVVTGGYWAFTVTDGAIRMLVGYQILVLIAPEMPAAELKASRNGKKLTVENHGNRNVLFRNGVQCAREEDLATRNEERCEGLEARRIYPGNVWNLDLNYDAPVEFILSEGGSAKLERF